MFKRRIGHAPINFTNLDLMFLHGVVHALLIVDALSVGPTEFSFVFERYDRSNNLKKTKSTKTIEKKQKKQYCRADTQSF